MQHTWEIQHLEQLQLAATEIATMLPKLGIVTFIGEMGAGKTTLIAAICKALGVTTPVSSPTYSLVNTYAYPDPKYGGYKIIHHMDLYRIKSVEEFLDAGIEELFYDDAVIYMEWPQIAQDYLVGHYFQIEIHQFDFALRRIVMTEHKK